MVKFLKNGSLLALVEQPNWVYLQENGAYGLCDYENAQGVAINGIVYNLAGNLIRTAKSISRIFPAVNI